MTEILALIASFFSAIAAWLSWRTAHRTALDSVRPYLVLSDWRINRIESGESTFEIDKCVNHGKAPAFQVLIIFGTDMWNTKTYGGGLEAEFTVRHIDCLAEKHEKKEMGELFGFKWEDKGGLMNVRVRYKDSMETQFETTYKFIFCSPDEIEHFQMGENNILSEVIAPGVALLTPWTTWETSFARLWAKIDGGRWSQFQKKRKMLKG